MIFLISSGKSKQLVSYPNYSPKTVWLDDTYGSIYGQDSQGICSGPPVCGLVNLFQICTESISILPDHILAAIADLVYDTKLGNSVRATNPG